MYASGTFAAKRSSFWVTTNVSAPSIRPLTSKNDVSPSDVVDAHVISRVIVGHLYRHLAQPLLDREYGIDGSSFDDRGVRSVSRRGT